MNSPGATDAAESMPIELREVFARAEALSVDCNVLGLPFVSDEGADGNDDSAGRARNYELTVASSLTPASRRLGATGLSLEGNELVHWAQHPTAVARAAILSFWPDANQGRGEVALYQQTHTYKPGRETVRGAAVTVLGGVLGGVIDNEALAGAYLGSGTLLGMDNGVQRVAPTNETQIYTAEVEGGRLGEEGEEVKRVSAKLGGTVTVRGSVWRVTDEAVYKLENDGLLFDAPSEDPFVVGPVGIPGFVDPTKAIVSDGDYFRTAHDRKMLSGPTVSLGRLASLVGKELPWRNVIPTILQGSYRIEEALPFGEPPVRRARLYAEAREQLADHRRRNQLRPDRVGLVAVDSALQLIREPAGFGRPYDADYFRS
jgi:hypothetical protein